MDIPEEVVRAATLVGRWTAENNIESWEIGPCASRKELAELRAFKAACEKQEAVAWLGSRFVTCDPALVKREEEKGFIFFNLYRNPDPEGAQLRMRVEELEKRNEALWIGLKEAAKLNASVTAQRDELVRLLGSYRDSVTFKIGSASPYREVAAEYGERVKEALASVREKA